MKGQTKWVALAIGVLLVGGVAYVASQNSTNANISVPKSAVPITYQIHGTAKSVDITMTTDSGISQQSSRPPVKNKNGDDGLVVRLPAGAPVSVSAQNTSGSAGTVECIILASDGAVIASNQSSGDAAIVSCSGRAR